MSKGREFLRLNTLPRVKNFARIEKFTTFEKSINNQIPFVVTAMTGFNSIKLRRLMGMEHGAIGTFREVGINGELSQICRDMSHVARQYRQYVENMGTYQHPQHPILEGVRKIILPDPTFHAMVAVEKVEREIILKNSYSNQPKVIICLDQLTYEEMVR